MIKAILLLITLSGNLSASEELVLEPDKTIALWPDRPLLENQRYYARRKNGLTYLIRERRPSLEIYQTTAASAPAPAVIICPGGGYARLAYDLEGTEIAHWLNKQGYHALVLRYTVPKKGDTAFEDIQRAMGLTRHHATEWNIQPDNIGLIGFSAGAHLAARMSTNWGQRTYEHVDEADLESNRPDFAALIYPSYISPKNIIKLVPEIRVTAKTPPTFLVQSLDDEYISSSKAYYRALKRSHVETEIHIFKQGIHGFGMRPSDYKISEWPGLYRDWLLKIANW